MNGVIIEPKTDTPSPEAVEMQREHEHKVIERNLEMMPLIAEPIGNINNFKNFGKLVAEAKKKNALKGAENTLEEQT